MQKKLRQTHLDLQARFDGLRDRLSKTPSDDERKQILQDLANLSDEVARLLNSSPQWDQQQH
jgi:hypothetical protein